MERKPLNTQDYYENTTLRSPKQRCRKWDKNPWHAGKIQRQTPRATPPEMPLHELLNIAKNNKTEGECYTVRRRRRIQRRTANSLGGKSSEGDPLTSCLIGI